MGTPAPPRIAVVSSDSAAAEETQPSPKPVVSKLALPASGLLAVQGVDVEEVLAETYREGVENPGWEEPAEAAPR